MTAMTADATTAPVPAIVGSGEVIATIRHTQFPRELQPAPAAAVMSRLSTAVMLGFALYYVGSNVF